MKKLFAACCAAFLLVVIVAPLAHAATEVNVRIEGKEETLFEKTIPVSIHPIEASSDTQERGCDGVNELDPENAVPGITPTLASAEAMESIGETFDGEWYEGFGDYFITRWATDEQDNSLGAYWGILVNNTLTSVGGCQYQLNQDDEVLWLWNAFSSRPMLALFPEAAHYTEGPRPTQVTVAPGEPVRLEVVAYGAGGEGVAPGTPSRAGSTPYDGAEVAPVTVSEKGFQRIDTASSEAVTTDEEGKASVVFTTPGIHRIKATEGPLGIEESVVRSNGLEICVLAKVGDCGEPVPRTTTTTETTSPSPSTTSAPTATQISKPKLDRGGLSQGKLTLDWNVLDLGAGVKVWRIATKTIGKKGGFVNRAHGTTATEATLHLPPGHGYRLRFILTDLSGHTTTYSLGKVTVPRAGKK
jgi:hypothetical protein